MASTFPRNTVYLAGQDNTMRNIRRNTTVKVNSSVTFTNTSMSPHTVTFGSEAALPFGGLIAHSVLSNVGLGENVSSGLFGAAFYRLRPANFGRVSLHRTRGVSRLLYLLRLYGHGAYNYGRPLTRASRPLASDAPSTSSTPSLAGLTRRGGVLLTGHPWRGGSKLGMVVLPMVCKRRLV